ncbi:hypothetical protein L6452_32868 [Arctium lappa]|uniref:Uncharacterized protein n=1 Tax=Arctium lappa TaxID=4217 RepID=A0ACB8ZA59_ARCLA|nr:hypothetical protein L6452_32868 [Arctium lappa]
MTAPPGALPTILSDTVSRLRRSLPFPQRSLPSPRQSHHPPLCKESSSLHRTLDEYESTYAILEGLSISALHSIRAKSEPIVPRTTAHQR